MFCNTVQDRPQRYHREAYLLLSLVLLLAIGSSGCAGVVSTNATSQSNPALMTITTVSLPPGALEAAYTEVLSASGGTAPYSWSVSAGSLPAGLTLSNAGQVSGTPTASGTSSFTVKVKDSSSPAQTATANLAILVTTVAVAPTIVTQPVNQTVTAGQTATFAVVAGGTAPLSYQWQKNRANIAGATAASYTTPVTTTSQSGTTFDVVVSDTAGTVTSGTATLTVTTAAVAPTIVTQPVNQTVTAGQTATFAVVAGGTAPLSYQWQKSGVNISGATAASYTTPVTTTSQSGTTFDVVVTNTAGTVTSGTATMTVNAAVVAPTITTSSLPNGQEGLAYSSSLAASGGTAPYSWSVSAGSLPAGLTLSNAGQISGTPTASGTSSFTVEVKDSSSPAQSATKNLSIVVAGVTPLQITTTTLPDGQVNSAYSMTVVASGGTMPYTWSIAAGSLPAGLSLGASSGQILGTPTTTGTSSFTISVKDASAVPQTATQVLSIFVSAAVTGTSITSCQTLGNSGTTYVLQNDVSAAGTCFTVTASNVTLNLNGHTVTYNAASQTSAVYAIVDSTGKSQGLAVYNGTLMEGTGSSASGSHVINMGQVVSGPTIHDVTFTWSANYSQAITADYSGSKVAGGAMIYSNILNNNTAAICSQVSCRDQLQSTSIIVMDAYASVNPAQIFSNTINGGPQGGLVCDAAGCLIHDNIINPGNQNISESNDFSIYCWASCNSYNNTIMAPLTANSQGRGIQLSGTECEMLNRPGCSGRNVHNNTISTIEKPNNAEYGNTCALGGAYGIQFDDQPANATAQNNNVTAVANLCWGTALRLTDTETTTNVSKNNTYTAIRQSASSPACNFIGGDSSTGCAHAVALDSPIAFTSQSDTFQGDSSDLFVDWDGGSGVIFISPTFLKGTTNPSPNFHTFVFRNGGTPVSNVHVQDATFGAGTGPTDTDLPAKGGNNQPTSLYIDWSQTVTVNKLSGGVAAGATVSFTDALGATYSGTTNASGVAVVVVTQYRLNNDNGANGIENHYPLKLNVSMSGCTTNTSTGLSISGIGSTIVTLGGC